MTTDPASHAAGWAEDEVLLADGERALLRRLKADDRDAVTDLFNSCSDQNLYTRFFSLGHALIARHLDHLLDEGSPAVTYVVQRGQRLVGVADVEPVERTTSEIAFLVADDAHGCGVATLLLERAAADARQAGTEWFVADVLAINHPMLTVFADAGFRVERHLHGGDVSLRMSTGDSPEVREATMARHRAAEERRLSRGEPT